MIKLIVADMDGTLLNDKHELHPDFWEIEEALHKNDILFAVASGRQYYNLESNFKRIKDRMIFFAENGTHVVHQDKELYVNELDAEAAKKFIEIGRTLNGVQVVLCGKTSAYVENKDEKFISEIKKYYERLEFVEDLTTVEDTILKVTICEWKGVEENSYKSFKEFEQDYKVAVAARIFLDITSKTANKGNAIKKVQEKLKISPEETLVFGDYLNDLEMMQNASYSYAMKNAHPEILKAGKHSTKFDNNENGVLKTILELELIDFPVVK
ncbi:Cof-type HAD-IIB family hydrolase [Antarcticibacterium sp. 1MA-6-2]|uniref:Cof-type HAD-IIB family hydrolase n=1 Tax=Antarcticibacterium sp. 1MA-6-2 TaxID=2908210 RepID=UPI001F2599F6|nr:Cof-type HAD-IIB family hydrolase [Antarcticibacterium sp. 1MA-6-2]UJH92228.1 Cof-type HAD-IIB family hydrolase [Antarcticibacterium sp. 1MA-6-2]